MDGKTLMDSSNSTKQVEEESIRQIVAGIKQHKEEEVVKDITWVNIDLMIADVFIQKNVQTDIILAVTPIGEINI